MRNVVAIIPARGGSKGIPGKNIRLLNGLPLIVHSILDAQESELVKNIYVTTDDPEIEKISVSFGANIIRRPSELATDTAASEAALTHALQRLEDNNAAPEIVVFLQCTSPIRSGQDIDNAIEKLCQEKADSLLSVSPSHRFIWEEVNGVARSVNYDYRHRKRRQDMKPQYVENGSIYVFKPWVLKELGNRLGGKISLFVMPEEKSWEIDTLADFSYVEFIATNSTQITK
jgi:N-acylneuraminate cytidylyltransferase